MDWRSGFVKYPRSKGRRRVAEVRSSVGESSWSASSHFLEARGRAVQLGTTAVGSLSPPMPALIRPPPLSKTTTFDITGDGLGSWRGNGFSDGRSFCFYFNNLFPANINYFFLCFFLPLQSSNYKYTQISNYICCETFCLLPLTHSVQVIL